MERTRRVTTVVVALAGLLGSARAGHAEDLTRLAREAVVSGDASRAAIAALRAAGPRGLDALLDVHAPALAAARDAAQPDAAQARLLAAVDAVAGQRHAAWSRLYWYTDLDAARAAARESGRPILSLRLLGQLDEDLSCANSRFFRVLLYANQEVAAALRTRFVLHWTSERPAPRLTVDFGDGRTLVRTIGGNSIHYVLDADGRVVDALPGLYGPQAFLAGLARAEAVALHLATLDPRSRQSALSAFHARRLTAMAVETAQDERRAGLGPMPGAQTTAAGGAPAALAADRIAMTKSAVERPLLRAMTGATQPPATDDVAWQRIALFHETERIDQTSLALVRRGLPGASAGRAVARLERSLTIESLRNERLLHARVHEWLASGASRDLEALNRKVYAELFLTPASDPWLGLVADDAYAALDR